MARLIMLTNVLLAAVALAVSGCGGGGDNGNKSPSSTGPAGGNQAGKPTGGSQAGSTVQVNMKNIQYVPSRVTARVGQTIKWTNTDTVAHTVTAQSGASFDSGTLEVGKTFEFTPKKAGTINYVCMIHPNQTGSITVVK